ncbi:MAG TPA: UvrD-helicase domain-containing protein [Acidimicrobiales bacterium]|nr:UvrD-helicase domain-containing protein [Acidimicrobiales bacterium]
MQVADHEARRRIAEDHHETLFVEAGAGSGKTSSLVSRVVALVLGGADVTQIAAITFTEAAAAELRARVRSTLEAVEAGAPVRWVTDSPDARRLAAEALDRLDRATICTLHAFAQRLLLAAPIEARLPPAIDVHDDISSALRFADRWQRFERRLLDDPAAAGAMRMALTLGIGSKELQVLAATLGQNWDLVEEARLAGLVDDDLAVDVDLSVLRVDDWIKALDEVVALRECCNDPDDKLSRWIDTTAAPLSVALEAARDDVHEVVLVATGSHARPHKGLGRKDCWADDGKARVIAAGCAVLDELKGAVDALTDQVLTRLGAELARYTLADAEARRREGRLEFHDLLVLARQVLRTRRSVRERFHHRYRHLLIDEFQDTDPIQVELAVRIAADPDHDPGTPWDQVDVAEGRLFFVGDPKQSIYRFRRADIDLFSRTAARYTGGATSLQVNFRTVEPVLRFCNAVFEALIAEATEHVDGGPPRIAQPPYVPLAPHRPALVGDPGPPVLVLGDGVPHGSADEARQAEALDVAAALRRAHEEGWLVDPGDGARPCRWADMAVLLPSRTTLSHLRSALDDADVPYRLESGTLVYGTTEVGELLSVLRAIDDPGDGVAIVGALRSAAYGCGDDDLLRWVRAHGRIAYLGDIVRADEAIEADPHADPVERALADLRRRHRDAPFRSIPTTVGAVVRERRLMELCLAGARARDLWRLYRVVLEHARQFADTEDGGLRAFLRWADLQRDDKLRATSPVLPEADVDAVRILTIHGAKGLEFGITAVSGLSAQDPNGVRGATVRFRPTGGFDVRMRTGMETARYEAVRTLDEAMDRHERTRLLYVALTRARDHLVVSSHHTARATSRSHGGRIAQRLAALGEELDDLAERWTASAPQDARTPAPPTVATDAGLPRAGVPTRQEWDAAVADLQRARDAAVRAAGGVRTASALARLLALDDVAPDADPDLEADGPRPGSAEPWRRGRSGTAVGSAVHAVLQHADLADRTGADVAGLARWQVAVAGLPADAAALVEAKARSALASPLLARAASSDLWRREVHVAVPAARILGTGGDAPDAPDAELVEGFVDLLFDDGAGGFVVVDHKTDDVRGARAQEEALRRYAPQGAAYALLVETATGRPVSEVHFLFLRADGADDVVVPDLPARVAEVRAVLAGEVGPS